MKWNSDNFKALVQATGMSVEGVADACGLARQSMFKYVRGEVAPSFESVMKLADFFAVPLDYMFGRCDEETAANILKDYGTHFMELRRAPYEAYLSGRSHIKRHLLRSRLCESPWPYNILDDIICPFPDEDAPDGEDTHWTDVLTPEQECGLRMAIDMLSERERAAIHLYYEQGMTLEATGSEYGVTRERMRQILARGVQKLRHPVMRQLIEAGPEYAEKESAYKKHREALDRKIAVIEDEERELSERLRRVSEAKLCLMANDLWYPSMNEEHSSPAKPSAINYQPITTMPIEAMALSVRSYNCLKRNDLNTLGLVMDAARNRKLARIRNFGRKSVEEVVNKIWVITGEDYSSLYGVGLYV